MNKTFSSICVLTALMTLFIMNHLQCWPALEAPTPAPVDTGVPTCRSLFTITRVPDVNLLANAHFLQHSRANKTNNDTLQGHAWTSLEHHLAKANSVLRHLLHQRSSPFGASTEDYRGLAKLLPSILSFKEVNNRSENHTTKKVGQIPTLTFTSRVHAYGGMLPHVPCVIAPFDDPATVTACFKVRMEKKPLWIVFMGDSKIRELFYEFLQRTDRQYHYTIKLRNTTVSFRNLRQNYVKLHEDMEATTLNARRLRITFYFRIFAEKIPSELKATKELQQLSRWATGEEAAPQLLVIGYTSWMMQRMMVSYAHDVFDYLKEVHQTVVPLLEQMSSRTRVLVLSQSRYRRHAVSGPIGSMRVAFSDASSDWSQMVFLYYLRRYREKHRPRAPSQPSENHPRPAAWSDNKAGYGPNTGKSPTHPNRDHLVPTEVSDGLWWWDTNLPLNLAAIKDCEEMYSRGLVTHPIYVASHIKCSDPTHADKATRIDMVTMLLNLMCNSVLEAHTDVCCS